MDTTARRGRLAEDVAAAFLCLDGYQILDRNFRYGRLEIDILAGRPGLLAVVEVKLRVRPVLGGAVGAVGIEKQRDLETAAVGYLRMRRLERVSVRFDVIAIEPLPAGRGLRVLHLPGAFTASGRYRA
jgi:putative endonuclease